MFFSWMWGGKESIMGFSDLMAQLYTTAALCTLTIEQINRWVRLIDSGFIGCHSRPTSYPLCRSIERTEGLAAQCSLA